MPAILTTSLPGTPISAKKCASSTLFVHFPLAVPAPNTADNASGEDPTDKGGVAQTLLLADAQPRETMPNMMQRRCKLSEKNYRVSHLPVDQQDKRYRGACAEQRGGRTLSTEGRLDYRTSIGQEQDK